MGETGFESRDGGTYTVDGVTVTSNIDAQSVEAWGRRVGIWVARRARTKNLVSSLIRALTGFYMRY